LVKTYSKNNDGKVNFDEFLFAVRGRPNDSRQAVIDLVYYKFDKSKTGFADPNELRKVFNCTRYPRFLSGELNEDQIFFLFLQNFSQRDNGLIAKNV
jgi:Ca2+-binding EF-hand superfamily protein